MDITYRFIIIDHETNNVDGEIALKYLFTFKKLIINLKEADALHYRHDML